MSSPIYTPRLELLPCTLQTYEAILMGNKALGLHLGVGILPGWDEFGLEPYRYALDQLQKDPASLPWWTYIAIHTEDSVFLGTVGYKGPPDADGVVEIGYAIVPAYRNLGLATEAAQGLVKRAFEDPAVSTVQAHTLAEENASVRVLKKCGMEFIKALNDPEDGDIWQWAILRPTS